MPKPSTTVLTITMLLTLPLLACDDSPTELSTSGTTSVQLTSSSGATSASLVSISPQAQANGGNVSLETVSSIDVTLETVEVLRLEQEDGSRWVSLDVEDQEINLLDLPADGLEIARGELESGDYCNLRLFVGDATVTFSEDVTLGDGPAATTFAADEEHDLFIPSENETGIKVPTVNFSVDEEQETVTIAFEAGESVHTINLTGRGILMTPVLTPEGEAGDQIAACGAAEDDENGDNGAGNGDNGEGGSGNGSNGGQ